MLQRAIKNVADLVKKVFNRLDGGVEVEKVERELVEDGAELALGGVFWDVWRGAGADQDADGLRWEFVSEVLNEPLVLLVNEDLALLARVGTLWEDPANVLESLFDDSHGVFTESKHVVKEGEGTLAEDAQAVVDRVNWEVAGTNHSADVLRWEGGIDPLDKLFEFDVDELDALVSPLALWEDVADPIEDPLEQLDSWAIGPNILKHGEAKNAAIAGAVNWIDWAVASAHKGAKGVSWIL